jgi:hypothetical protein
VLIMADIVGRIKKLIALSSRNDSPEEAANAAALAQDLMFKYQIGMVDLDATDTDARMPEGIVDAPIASGDKRRAIWKSSLAHAVATGFGCEMYFDRTVNGFNFHIFGTDSAVQTVHYMYGYLLLEITRLSEEAWSAHGRETRENGKTWKNSFRLAAVSELRKRLQTKRVAQQREVAVAPTTTAIALYKTDAERVTNEWKATEKRLRLRPAPVARVQQSLSAFDRGRAAGMHIGLDAKGSIEGSKKRMK